MSKRSKIIIIVLVVICILFVYVFKKYFVNKDDNLNSGENVNAEFNFEINEVLDVNKLKKYNLPIIIQFESESCGACKVMKPILKKLNNELKGKAIIRYIDVWKNPGYAKGYSFEYIPTQIFIDSNGNNFKPSSNLGSIDFEFKKNDLGYEYTSHTGILYEEEILSILKEMGYND